MKRFNIKMRAYALALGLSIFGCSPSSNYGVHNPVPYTEEEQTFDYMLERETPKLDLVFVIDNSESMHNHLENLSKNIKEFTASFDPNRMDLRVGVLTVFDSVRYKEYESVDDEQRVLDAEYFESLRGEIHREYLNAVSDGERSTMGKLGMEMFQLTLPGFYAADPRYSYFKDQGLSNMVLPSGVLRPPRLNASDYDFERRFLTGEDADFLSTLERTLLVTHEFNQLDPEESWARYGSPVIEEVFSVVQSLVDPTVNLSWNHEFLRGEDAHLAIVLVTDAEDETVDAQTGELMDPSVIARQLRAVKGGNSRNLSLYGVLSLESDGVESCETDSYVEENGEFVSKRPQRVASLVRMMSGSTLSLCSPNFGRELAEIGGDLASRVFESNHFVLAKIPTSVHDITVYVDDVALDPSDWTYNNYDQSVEIKNLEKVRALVRITYRSPNPAKLASGELLPDGAQYSEDQE